MVKKPVLLDHLGRPVSSAELKVEVASPSVTSIRSILSSHPEVGLDPVRLAQILQGAEQGDPTRYLELAEAMEEKDLHYLGVLGTRKRAVSQLPITVECGIEDAAGEAIAQEVRDLLERDTIEAELEDILDAVGKGFSATEIIWDTSEGQWLPIDFKYRLPAWFLFDPVDGETLRLRDGSTVGADLQPFKWIVHKHKAKSGLPMRGGLARAAAWTYLFKNFTLKDWVAFAEIYGLPFRLGKYDTGASDQDRRALLNALAMMGSDAAGIIPTTTQVEFVAGAGGTGDHALFKGLLEYLDEQVSKAVLGQTSTTDAKAGGLGSGQANVHNDVRADIERADAKLLAATVNAQIVRPYVQLNHGPQKKYPRVVIGRPEAIDLKGSVDAITSLVPLGLRVPLSHARKLTGTPEPEGDEECLQAPAAAPAIAPAQTDPKTGLPMVTAANDKTARTAAQEPRGGQTPAERRAAASTGLLAPLRGLLDAELGAADPIDRLVGAALSDWAPMMDPQISLIEERLAACSSLEEARDMLAGLLGGMNVDRLAEGLARASFAARVAGKVGVLTVPEDEA